MAEPVWIDIDESDTLEYRSAKDHQDERHLTPTQLKPIKWCNLMYSNKGDTVLCPFMGIGMDRKFIGIELKPSYFDIAVKNLKNAIDKKAMQTLF